MLWRVLGVWSCAVGLSLLGTGCDSKDDHGPNEPEAPTIPEFLLTSPAFSAGESIPYPFTCEGIQFPYDGPPHRSPALEWTDGPEGTASYALLLKDLTLTENIPVNELGFHWAIWDIPGSARSLPEGLSPGKNPEVPAGATQFSGPLFNDGYVGPCPSWQAATDPAIPRNTDRYSFTLFALPAANLAPPPLETGSPASYVHALDHFLEGNALAKAELRGISDAQPSAFVPPFGLTSPAFEDGATIPPEYTCEGIKFPYDGPPHLSPELRWSAGPAETLSYAIVFKDLSLTTATPVNELGYHWAIWDIPVSARALPRGLSTGKNPVVPAGATQFSGPLFDDGYVGPCPSWQAATDPAIPRVTDNYTFTLFALPVAKLAAPAQDPGSTLSYVHILDDYLKANAVATVELRGKSNAKPSAFAPPFGLTSPAFQNGATIPPEYTCEGVQFPYDGPPHTSPELSWTPGPTGTESYAILFKDVTLTTATPVNELGYHWAIWDIPASTLALPKGLSPGKHPEIPAGATQASGPLFDDGYVGPCPSWQAATDPAIPRNTDQYTFTLFALPVGSLAVPAPDPTSSLSYVHALEDYLKANALDAVELGGTSDAKPSEFVPPFGITSSAFEDGASIPEKYTCEGVQFPFGGPPHTSPALSWTAGPKETKSYAIVFKDVTLVEDENELGYHWAIWDIPADTLALPEGLSSGKNPEVPAGATQASGPLFDDGYVGPCPSWEAATDDSIARKTDDYTFTLYALPDESLSPPEPDPDSEQSYVHVLDDFLKEHALEAVELHGTSNAQPSEFVPPPAPEEEE